MDLARRAQTGSGPTSRATRWPRHQLAAGRLHQAAHRRRADLHHVARRERQATFERHGVPMAEVTPKITRRGTRVRKAFQEHGWWQAKDIEPRQLGQCTATRPARCAHDRMGPPRLHGRQGHRRLEAGLVHPDDEAGDLVHRHGIAPSDHPEWRASHLHRAASTARRTATHQGVPA